MKKFNLVENELEIILNLIIAFPQKRKYFVKVATIVKNLSPKQLYYLAKKYKHFPDPIIYYIFATKKLSCDQMLEILIFVKIPNLCRAAIRTNLFSKIRQKEIEQLILKFENEKRIEYWESILGSNTKDHC